ncbi:MAG: hypothetical protein VYA80_07890 [Pseudomonadota bacterium]|nr:hypothetical protein [Pseudomonadota bacterium]
MYFLQEAPEFCRVLTIKLILIIITGCSSFQSDIDRFAPGRWEVASNEAVTLFDTHFHREVNVRVYYPADANKQQFPVIVFSHGAFCYPQQYRNVTDFWVSHGYIVILPDHLDSPNLGKIDPKNLSILLKSRVADMSLVLDSIIDIERAIPDLSGHIDSNRFAVGGHSLGGFIAMVKSGLELKDSEQDPGVIFSDERFDVAVIMSGVGKMEQMTDDAFDGLTRPLFASGGTLDVGNIGVGEIYPWEWRMSSFTLSPPGEKYSFVLDNADHYLGGQICRENRGGSEDLQGVSLVRAANLAFLEAYVRDDADSKSWLVQTNWLNASDGRATLESK